MNKAESTLTVKEKLLAIGILKLTMDNANYTPDEIESVINEAIWGTLTSYTDEDILRIGVEVTEDDFQRRKKLGLEKEIPDDELPFQAE